MSIITLSRVITFKSKIMLMFLTRSSLSVYCMVFILSFSPGPNSPHQWMKKCIETLVPEANSPNRKKILMGLNFYGNDYVPGGGGPIVASQ